MGALKIDFRSDKLSQIIIPECNYTWEAKNTSYKTNEEMFLTIYIYFRTDGFGECRTSFKELAETMGYSVKSRSSVLAAKERIAQTLQGLLLRNTEEHQAADMMTIKDFDRDLSGVTSSECFTIHVQKKTMMFSDMKFSCVSPELFMKITKLAQAHNVSPASFFSYYLYMNSAMYLIDGHREEGIRGCWKFRPAILSAIGICSPTYTKYRKILNDAQIVFFKQEKYSYTPTMFATVDSETVWAEIRKSYK